jgi:hypothetical protein
VSRLSRRLVTAKPIGRSRKPEAKPDARERARARSPSPASPRVTASRPFPDGSARGYSRPTGAVTRHHERVADGRLRPPTPGLGHFPLMSTSCPPEIIRARVAEVMRQSAFRNRSRWHARAARCSALVIVIDSRGSLLGVALQSLRHDKPRGYGVNAKIRWLKASIIAGAVADAIIGVMTTRYQVPRMLGS